jgi:hypothetical protein
MLEDVKEKALAMPVVSDEEGDDELDEEVSEEEEYEEYSEGERPAKRQRQDDTWY